MTDTSPAMASLQRRLLMERPAEERKRVTNPVW
jgi:hypothetical protein